jgi:hypothetical protein
MLPILSSYPWHHELIHPSKSSILFRGSTEHLYSFSRIFQNDNSLNYVPGIKKLKIWKIWNFETLNKFWKSMYGNLLLTITRICFINMIFPQRSWGATLRRPKGRQKRGCGGRAPAYCYFNKQSPYCPPAFGLAYTCSQFFPLSYPWHHELIHPSKSSIIN